MDINESGVDGFGECLSDEELKSYLGSTPGRRSRAEVQEHLSQCFECRSRLVRLMDASLEDESSEATVSSKATVSSEVTVIPEDVMAKVRNLPFEAAEPESQLGHRPYFALAAGFILAIIGLGLWWRMPETSVVGPEIERVAETTVLRQADGSPLVTLESPGHGSRLTTEGLELAWQPVPGADHYTAHVLGPLGQILVQEDTRDTELIPSLESTEPCSADHGPCFWYVTVHLKTGTSHDSQIRELWILGDG